MFTQFRRKGTKKKLYVQILGSFLGKFLFGAFCRGLDREIHVPKLRFGSKYSDQLRSPQELEIIGDPIGCGAR